MAVVRDPVGRAQAVSTRKQAARLRLDLEGELALNDQLPAGWEGEADQAIGILNDRFDDLADDEAERAPQLSNRAQGNSRRGHVPGAPDGARRRAAGGEGRRRGGGAPPNPSRAARGPRRRAGGAPPALRRAIQQTGVPSAAGSTSQLVLQVFGGIFGLAVIYLLINEQGRGPQAFSRLLGGVATGVRALVAPVDPLRPNAGQTASGRAAIAAGLLQPNSPLAAAPVVRPGPVTRIPVTPTPPNRVRHPIGG